MAAPRRQRVATRRRPNRVERTSGTLADNRLLKQTVAEMDDKFLLCRDGRHLYPTYKVREVERGVFEQTFTCARDCGASVVKHIDRGGYILDRKVKYQNKDYLLTGFGRATQATKAMMRLESIQRVIR